MGRQLAQAFPAARSVFCRANEALGFDLSRIAWEGPEDELVATENAQPAILTHGLAVWAVVRDRVVGRIRFAAGHSLGEFAAYTAAGALDLEDAVHLVRRRGELMAASGAERPGTMSAVVGLGDEEVEAICAAVSRNDDRVVPANYNSPGQVVVSGTVQAVERAEAAAREAGARMVRRLAVSGAFHSPLMSVAEADLRAELERLELSDPEFPVVANVTAEPVRDAATARSLMVSQLTSPVRWGQGIQRMAREGTRSFLELGPGRVLTGLLRRIDRELEGIALGEPDAIRDFIEEDL
jgi:[acyl-carrier-protein] S-malonyltransferase